MVRSQSMSAGRRGLLVRLARFSAPVTAERARWASRRSRSLVTVRTTARADSRACSGSTWLSDSRVPTRCTSGWTALSISGSSSSRVRPSRSIASFCMTWTTLTGKNVRISPSQRATCGADAPSPACRFPGGSGPLPASEPESYKAPSAASIRASSPVRETPVPTPEAPESAAPSASRQRRIRSS